MNINLTSIGKTDVGELFAVEHGDGFFLAGIYTGDNAYVLRACFEGGLLPQSDVDEPFGSVAEAAQHACDFFDYFKPAVPYDNGSHRAARTAASDEFFNRLEVVLAVLDAYAGSDRLLLTE